MSKIEGFIVRSQSRAYFARTEGREIPVHVPKKFRYADATSVDPIAVGDRVMLETETGEAVVCEILPRSNTITRPASGRKGKHQLLAANLDRLVIVMSTREPEVKNATIDRYLVMASMHGIAPYLVINKVELKPELVDDPSFDYYRKHGIETRFVSTITGEGIDTLRKDLGTLTVAFLGPSGVGKSSILNALIPGADRRVGEISEQTQKGRHTTTWVELMDLPPSGAIIDSPGIRVLDLTALEAHELASHFAEFHGPDRGCKFRDCSHTAEPGCEVKAQVESGELSSARYDSYLRIYASLEAGTG